MSEKVEISGRIMHKVQDYFFPNCLEDGCRWTGNRYEVYGEALIGLAEHVQEKHQEAS